MENEINSSIPEMIVAEPKPLPMSALVLQAKLTPESPLAQAVREFANRQSRQRHPDGEFDSAKRWDPSAAEHRDCCDGIRTPSRSYPYSLMVHCRSAEHVANLYGVDVSAVRRVSGALKKESKAAAAGAKLEAEQKAAADAEAMLRHAAEGRAMMAAAA